MIVEDDAVVRAIENIGVQPAQIIEAVESRLPLPGEQAGADAATITPSASRALFHAYQVARSAGATYIDPEHLFFALVLGQDVPAGQVLARAGVTAEALTQGAREHVNAPVGGDAPDAAETASDSPMLDKYGLDLTGRARE